MSSSNAKSQHQLLIFVKFLVLVGVVVLSGKLSKQTFDHTTFARRDNASSSANNAHEQRKTSTPRLSDDDNIQTETTIPPPSQELDVPIFLMDPSSHELSTREWKSIARQWNRNTTYTDILQSNSTIPHAMIPFPKNKRILVFHHLMPKTASSTLRQSCQDTQLDTCGIEPKGPGNKRPDGYMTIKRVIQVMIECPKTTHYCVKADTQPLTRNYTQFHETNAFLHLFPFRNYDEWVVSALKQVYFRDGEKGCLEEDKLLDECQPHKYELDFDRYGKSSLSYFLRSWRWLKRKQLGFEEHHHMLMYDYRYLHGTLESLHEMYDIPLLAGTDAKKNSDRPEGTCQDDVKLLQKFHDCFSDALIEVE